MGRPKNEKRKFRRTETESGKVLKIEWVCPKCGGRGWNKKSPAKGCKLCKGLGWVDGIANAIWQENQLKKKKDKES